MNATPRLLALAAALLLTGCGTPSLITITTAGTEAREAKAAADAGSTVGVAKAIAGSQTIAGAVASAQPTGANKTADALISAGKIVSSPEVGAVVKAGVTAGSAAAGMSDPNTTGVLADAARVGLGGLLVAAGAALNAWANRKKQTAPPPQS
jgi:hypothetical protein